MMDLSGVQLVSGFLGKAVVWEYVIPGTWREKGEMIIGIGSSKMEVDNFRKWIEVYLQTEGGIGAAAKFAMSLCSEDTVAFFVIEGDVIWYIGRNLNAWLVRGNDVIRLSVLSDQLLSGWLHPQDYYVVSDGIVDEESVSVEGFWNAVEGFDGALLCWRQVIEDEQPIEEISTIPELVEEPTIQLEPRQTWWQTFIRGIIHLLPSQERVWSWEDYLKLQENGGSGRKLLLFSAVGVLVLMVILGGVGAWHTRVSYSQAEINRLVLSAQGKLQESVDLSALNPLRSEALLSEAQGLISTLEQNGVSFQQLSDLKSQLQTAQQSALGEHSGTPVTWMDLSLIREGLTAQAWAMDEAFFYILDGEAGRVLRINRETKAADVVSSDDSLKNAGLIAVSDGVLWLASGKNVLRINGSTVNSLALTGDQGEVVGIGAFGDSGYLNTTTGIWRVMGNENLSWKQWLKDDEVLTTWLPKEGMSIDGSLWLARQSDIEKWVSGKKASYTVQGLLEPLTEVRALFTQEQLKDLYILDTGRVVRITKETGTYVSQYQWENLQSVVSVVADETQGNMWWLTSGVIYEVSL